MLTLLIGTVSAFYLGGGFLTWLITAVEMLGDVSGNSYLASLNDFSKRSTVTEVLTFIYLILGWPVHQVLKVVYKA